MEVLDLEYEVKVYLRHPQTWRGPPELFKAHPLGKAPVLEVIFGDGSPPLKLAETGLIFQYLLNNYDHENLLTPTDPRDKLKVDYFLHYAEGTLQGLLITLLINSVAKKIAPFGFQTLAKLVTRGLNNGYYLHEWYLSVDFLESELKKNGTEYFVGDRLSAADIMLSFPVYENIFDNPGGIKECVGITDDLYKLYPNLGGWCCRIRDDPVYVKIGAMMDEKVEQFKQKKGRRKSK